MAASLGCLVVSGKKLADGITSQIKTEIDTLKANTKHVPGISCTVHKLTDNVQQDEVLALVDALNGDHDVHGILIQLPLPDHLNEAVILGAVAHHKDVDGFHPTSVGHLALNGPNDPHCFVPPTPLGCIALLVAGGLSTFSGLHAVVLGRSKLVGKPVAMLLQALNATVTVCHSQTPLQLLQTLIKTADIVVVAIGKPHFVRGAWLKPGCAVIDVGMNYIDDPSKSNGNKLVGDVHFDEAKEVAAVITPVPGGVGPLTICMLLSNTLLSFCRVHHIPFPLQHLPSVVPTSGSASSVPPPPVAAAPSTSSAAAAPAAIGASAVSAAPAAADASASGPADAKS